MTTAAMRSHTITVYAVGLDDEAYEALFDLVADAVYECSEDACVWARETDPVPDDD